jgi:hypothetical protein
MLLQVLRFIDDDKGNRAEINEQTPIPLHNFPCNCAGVVKILGFEDASGPNELSLNHSKR